MLVASTGNSVEVISWGLVLIGAIGVLGGAVWYLRGRLFGTAASDADSVWSLQQLRDMRASRQISEAEFQRLRAEMIGAHGLSDGGAMHASDAHPGDADDGWIDVKSATDEGR